MAFENVSVVIRSLGPHLEHSSPHIGHTWTVHSKFKIKYLHCCLSVCVTVVFKLFLIHLEVQYVKEIKEKPVVLKGAETQNSQDC